MHFLVRIGNYLKSGSSHEISSSVCMDARFKGCILSLNALGTSDLRLKLF